MDTTACYYNIQHFHERAAIYTCCLYKKDITSETKFLGQQLSDRTDADVRGVALSHCTFTPGFPRNLSTYFPNLDHITINGGLRNLTKDDLAGYGDLKFLDLQGCEMTALPDDLFEHTPNLEVIYFSHNHIASMGPNLLEPLTKLKYIDLRGNANINVVYDVDKSKELSLEDLKSLISERCHVQNGAADNSNTKTNSLRVSGAK